MKYLALLPLAILAFTSCKKNRSLNRERYYYRTATYYNGMAVNENNPYSLYDSVAHSRLFYYVYASDIKHANDASSGSIIVFDVPDSITSFTITGDDLAKHHTFYDTYDGWGGGAFTRLEKGFITGHMLGDSTWKLTLIIQVPQQGGIPDYDSIVDTIIAHDPAHEQMVYGRLY